MKNNEKPLSGSRVNTARVIVLHGPPGAGKTTAVKYVLENKSAGVHAYDAETGGNTKEKRQHALLEFLRSVSQARFNHVVVGAADQSDFLLDNLPAARHVFISPDAETLEARHLSRGESFPAKLKQDSAGIHASMKGNPRFSSLETTSDAKAWLLDNTSALPQTTSRVSITGDEAIELINNDEYRALLADVDKDPPSQQAISEELVRMFGNG